MQIVAGALLAQRYRAESLLGRGGMGEVWRCRDLEQRQDVAIKAVRPDFLQDPGAAKLFHSEIVAVARLSHPGIIPVLDLIRDPSGSALLVMAFRDGPSLSSFSTAELSWPFIASVLIQVLEALAYAHARGVLHLDIKPENVLLERVNGEARATLLDFGISRIRKPGRGIERWFDRDAVIGTVEYMSPEQCSGTFERLGPWSDLFSVGAMAFELCVGRRPFPGPSDPTGMVNRLTAPPPPLVPRIPNVPAGFVELTAMLLANEPRNRPFQAADVLQMLRALDPEAGRASLPPLPAPGAPRTAPDAVTQMATDPPSYTPGKPELRALETKPLPVTVVPSHRPSSMSGSGDVELAFTAEAELPPTGAYGLFGLRDLPVLGRPDERRVVWSAVHAAVTLKEPRVVLLEGPTGVGKSRLARDAMERAVELGLCVPMQTSWSPQGSGDEGLRGLVENLLDTRGSPAPQLRARLEFWLDRIPGSHRAFSREVELFLRPPRDAAPDAGLPLRVAVEAIARASMLRPVLLWLDDVQWSRGEAVALLSALRARRPRVAACVIATARSEEIRDRAAHEAMASAEDTERVRLDPLDLDATRRLVRGLLDVDDPLCDVIAARAEGNPLFVTQLLHQLVAAEAVERRAGHYRLAKAFDLAAIPADIQAVWTRRVEQAEVDTRDLAALALVRDRVSLEVADELSRRLGRASFERSISRALSSGLLRLEGGAYAWAHGLLRAHLVDSLDPQGRRVLHAVAAAALAPLIDREDVQEERAQHLHAAGDAAGACRAMIEAGLWSFRRADMAPRKARFDQAAAWAREAALADLEVRALAESAYASAEQGEGAMADELLALAARRAGPKIGGEAACWLCLRRAQVGRLQGRADEGRTATEEALALARAHQVSEVERLTLLQLGLDAYRRGDVATSRRLLKEAGALCRAAEDRVGEAHATRVLSAFEEPAAALGMVERSIELCRSAGALRVELSCKQVWVDLLWKSGARDAARHEARELAAEAARRRLRQTVSLLELQGAEWAASEHDWEDARAHCASAAAWGARTGAMAEQVTLAALEVLIAVASGDERSADDALSALEPIRRGYNDESIGKLLADAASLAQAPLSDRLRALA
ncbi:MAG: protein kinase [Byssovorax sp.]